MTIMVTGSTGQVGGELVKALAGQGEVIAPVRGELDMARPEMVREFLLKAQPRWIVNPAAYTAVDKAESEPELAYTINAASVKVMGETAREIGATVIHYSTDYVFDGSGTQPYREDDATGPVSVYGASKLEGEQALESSGAAHMIFRTSWVFGGTGKNFLLTILRLAREREQMKIVADQHGAPTWSRNLAQMTAAVIRRSEGLDLAAVSGVYHAAGAGETTWHGFATEIVRLARLKEPGTAFAEMVPVGTSEYPTPARRPANSRLNCGKLARTLGWEMMDWRHAVAQVIKEL